MLNYIRIAFLTVIIAVALISQTDTSAAKKGDPGTIWTVIGGKENGKRGKKNPEGVAASDAKLESLANVDVAKDGRIFFDNDAVLKVMSKEGVISTIAGGGKIEPKSVDSDGVAPTLVDLTGRNGFVVHTDGRVFISEGNSIYVIEKDKFKRFAGFPKLRPVGSITGSLTLDGLKDSFRGFVLENQNHHGEKEALPSPINFSASNIKGESKLTAAADHTQGAVRFTGGVQLGLTSLGDGGPALFAEFAQPAGMTVSKDGKRLYVAELWGHRIRKIDLQTGIVTTAAGSGESGYYGDGGPAIDAKLYEPSNISVSDTEPVNGNDEFYITDTRNGLIRKVGTDGVITRVAGLAPGQVEESSFKSGPALKKDLSSPRRVIALTRGEFLIIDDKQSLVFKVNPHGLLTTFAGRPRKHPSAKLEENVQAAVTDLGRPTDAAPLPDGKGILLVDSGLNRIRQIKYSLN